MAASKAAVVRTTEPERGGSVLPHPAQEGLPRRGGTVKAGGPAEVCARPGADTEHALSTRSAVSFLLHLYISWAILIHISDERKHVKAEHEI